jgi:uncharacterized membrane protein YphA (DoxX/SURF4 family)
MQRLTHFLNQRTDPRPLAIARIVIALAALVKILQMSFSLRQFATRDYVSFPYLIEFPAPESDTGALVVIGLWITFGVFFLLGLWTRIAGFGLALTILYAISIDQQLYSNHLYLLATLVALLTLADCGARFSLDAQSEVEKRDVPRWPVTLLKLQVTSVYLFAAVSKLNASFLDGTVIRIAFDPAMLERVTGVLSLETVAIAAITTELFLAFGFWISRVRWVAATGAATFHLMNVVMMDRGGSLNLAVFGVMMGAIILLFFSDLWERESEASIAQEMRPIQAERGVAG